MDIVMGSRKWQGDVPYLVEAGRPAEHEKPPLTEEWYSTWNILETRLLQGNRNGPSVVQNVAERLNKKNSEPCLQDVRSRGLFPRVCGGPYVALKVLPGSQRHD